jgi:hypothetical protein
MKEFIQKLIDSLDTNKSGFSGRKLTAFAIVICVIAIHIKWLSLGDFNQLESVFMIDYSFIAALFGMTTYQNLKNKE